MLREPSSAEATGAPSVLADRYRVIALLGTGGMGSVYLAQDTELGELVALKMINDDLARDDMALERFRNEVRLARRVTHVNVARTFDIGEHRGARFLTMEYIAGEALSAVVSREAPLPPSRVVGIADDLCAGLAAAHAAGVIHRDLKPQNVLLAADGGRAVITDFGIALSSTETDHAVGAVVGTPMYMAPEQLVGATVDARSDIFSLGAILYLMSTGKRPFPPKTARAPDMKPSDPRCHVPSMPPDLADIILRCLSLDPAARYSDADELRKIIARLPHPSSSVAKHEAERERRLVRIVREEGFRHIALAAIPVRGLDASYAEGVRAALLDRLKEQRGLIAIREEGAVEPPESVVRASLGLTDGVLELSLTLESRDGYRVLAESLRGAPSDLLALLDHAAALLGRALAMPARTPPSSASVETDEAMDLYFRARAEYRGYWEAPVTRSIGLFERARGLSPNQPLILAGLAIARARKCFFDGSEIDEARSAAERAVRFGADRPEAHLATASVAMQSNRPVEAATALARAIALAPGLIESQVMLARLLGELGAPVDAITLATHALARAPETHDVRPDLMRTYTLLGDFAAADRVIAPLEENSAAWVIVAVSNIRFALWRRDVEQVRAMTERFRALRGEAPMFAVIDTFVDTFLGRIPPLSMQEFAALLPYAPTPRRASHHFQLIAEWCGFVGDRAGGLEALERSQALGLVDALWIERCPLLDEFRGTRRFETVHDVIRARARDALTAFDAMDADDADDGGQGRAVFDVGSEATVAVPRG